MEERSSLQRRYGDRDVTSDEDVVSDGDIDVVSDEDVVSDREDNGDSVRWR